MQRLVLQKVDPVAAEQLKVAPTLESALTDSGGRHQADDAVHQEVTMEAVHTACWSAVAARLAMHRLRPMLRDAGSSSSREGHSLDRVFRDLMMPGAAAAASLHCHPLCFDARKAREEKVAAGRCARLLENTCKAMEATAVCGADKPKGATHKRHRQRQLEDPRCRGGCQPQSSHDVLLERLRLQLDALGRLSSSLDRLLDNASSSTPEAADSRQNQQPGVGVSVEDCCRRPLADRDSNSLTHCSHDQVGHPAAQRSAPHVQTCHPSCDASDAPPQSLFLRHRDAPWAAGSDHLAGGVSACRRQLDHMPGDTIASLLTPELVPVIGATVLRSAGEASAALRPGAHEPRTSGEMPQGCPLCPGMPVVVELPCKLSGVGRPGKFESGLQLGTGQEKASHSHAPAGGGLPHQGSVFVAGVIENLLGSCQGRAGAAGPAASHAVSKSSLMGHPQSTPVPLAPVGDRHGTQPPFASAPQREGKGGSGLWPCKALDFDHSSHNSVRPPGPCAASHKSGVPPSRGGSESEGRCLVTVVRPCSRYPESSPTCSRPLQGTRGMQHKQYPDPLQPHCHETFEVPLSAVHPLDSLLAGSSEDQSRPVTTLEVPVIAPLSGRGLLSSPVPGHLLVWGSLRAPLLQAMACLSGDPGLIAAVEAAASSQQDPARMVAAAWTARRRQQQAATRARNCQEATADGRQAGQRDGRQPSCQHSIADADTYKQHSLAADDVRAMIEGLMCASRCGSDPAEGQRCDPVGGRAAGAGISRLNPAEARALWHEFLQAFPSVAAWRAQLFMDAARLGGRVETVTGRPCFLQDETARVLAAHHPHEEQLTPGSSAAHSPMKLRPCKTERLAGGASAASMNAGASTLASAEAYAVSAALTESAADLLDTAVIDLHRSCRLQQQPRSTPRHPGQPSADAPHQAGPLWRPYLVSRGTGEVVVHGPSQELATMAGLLRGALQEAPLRAWGIPLRCLAAEVRCGESLDLLGSRLLSP